MHLYPTSFGTIRTSRVFLPLLIRVIVLLSLMTGLVCCQPSLRHGPVSMDIFFVPPVDIRFNGSIHPESLLVHGRFEITLRNNTGDTLKYLHLSNGVPVFIRTRLDSQRREADSVDARVVDSLYNSENPFCLIDSILFRGVPLTSDKWTTGDYGLKIKLPVAIPPKDRVYLMGYLHARGELVTADSSIVHFGCWLPLIEVPSLVADSNEIFSHRELARFQMLFEMDTTWRMVCPGELVNDKEHYGLLSVPDDQTVLVDVVGNHQLEYLGRIYQPEFEGGKKKYILRAGPLLSFPVTVSRSFLRDRTITDSVFIEVCYPASYQKIWSSKLANAASIYAKKLKNILGPCPHAYLRIVPGLYDSASSVFQPLILLPPMIKNVDSLLSIMRISMVEGWLMPPAAGNSSNLDFRKLLVSIGLEYLDNSNISEKTLLDLNLDAVENAPAPVSIVRDFIIENRYEFLSEAKWTDYLKMVRDTSRLPTKTGNTEDH